MKKVLILAYDYPPYVSVGGLRPYSWMSYLYDNNVFPVVITRQWDNKFGNHLDYISPSLSTKTIIEESVRGVVLRTPYKPTFPNRLLLKYGDTRFKVLRKSISAVLEFGQYIFLTGSKKNIFFEADKYIENNNIDIIIATGDPFILFKYASDLSRKHNIPWIADYRDPWVQDKSVNNPFIRKWYTYLEKKIVKTAHKVLTVSTFCRRQIEQNLKEKDFEIIYNGFDPKIRTAIEKNRQNSETLSIAFAGTVYEWHPIESFFKVCNEIIKETPDFKLNLNFYGVNKENELKDILSAKYKHVEKFVNFYPIMSNTDLALSLAEQNVFLLFNDYSILGTKIFDYLALKRQIILCYENDKKAIELKKKHYHLEEMSNESKSLQADLIKATNSGIIVKNSEHLKSIIFEMSSELEKKGSILCKSINVEDYSRVKQVKRLADIINKI